MSRKQELRNKLKEIREKEENRKKEIKEIIYRNGKITLQELRKKHQNND